MKSEKDAMLPKANVVNVSDLEVTGVDPLLDETEPFLLAERSDEEIADYEEGFQCGQDGGQNDATKSEAWQRGWAEAQE